MAKRTATTSQPLFGWSEQWRTKALIGACGGICLVLIRLIEANFYLDRDQSQIAGGLLLGASFVVLSAIFTVFVEEENPAKLFMQGLLAPSLLVALVHPQPPAETTEFPHPTETTSGVPELGMWERLFAPSTASAQAEVPIVNEAQFKGRLSEGAWLMFGRTPEPADHVFVLGKVDAVERGNELVGQYNALLGKGPKAKLVRFDGLEGYYVYLGQFGSVARAQATQDMAVRHLLASPRTEDGAEAIETILRGTVVNAPALLRNTAAAEF